MTSNDPSPATGPSGPLTILIGADTFPPNVNGAARFTSRLAAGMTGRGHRVVIMAPGFDRTHGVFMEEHDGAMLEVHRLYSWRWLNHPWFRFVLPWRSKAHARRVLDAVKPDVVHIQSHIVVGRGLTREAVRRGIRVVATNHFMPENIMEHTLIPRFLRAFATRIAWRDAAKTYHRCESVTTPTRKAADFLESETDIVGVHAISCGLNAGDYTSNPTRPAENRVVFVGRVTAEKHIDVLIKAVAKIDPALDVKLDIIGGGELMDHLKRLVAGLGISENTTFTGYVSDEELRAGLTRATVFSIPSIAELQSIATMEAMASGLPVVAANAMALPHLVHDGQNGYLFEPGDTDDLAEKLTRVLTATDAEYLRMKRASLALIQPHDIEGTLSTFERLYRGLPVTDPVTEVSLDGLGD